MSKVTVIVGQSGKSEKLREIGSLIQAEKHKWVYRFSSWKQRGPWFNSNWRDKPGAVFLFDDFDAGLDHRIMQQVVQELLSKINIENDIYLVVYTLDMIDILLDNVDHKDLTFIRVQSDGTCVKATAEEVAVIRETWGGDIR